MLKNGGNAGGTPLTWRNGGKPFDKKQMKYINQMFRSHSSTKEESGSDSKSAVGTTGWKKGISTVHQMYIIQQYRQDNGMDSDKDVKSIDSNQVKSLRKKAKKAENSSNVAEKYTQYSMLVRNNVKFRRSNQSDRATNDTLIYV
mmetsp:Transcript_45786/g.46433  ORF Transcript_45786/g.46433 Transcript_45786/m.46433 type:complete len:144 (+) Transcript_45786:139-570(+)